MKITRISVWQLTMPLNEPYWLSGGRLKFEELDSTFVRIDTDEGVSGWGEGCPWGHTYLPAHGPGIRAGIQTLAPFLIGQDPSIPDQINRIMDVFPPHQQSQIRAQLSFVLQGVLCQSLVPKKTGGRALVAEIMIPNDAIRNLMREDKNHQIYSQMQIGQAQHGMQTRNQCLSDLVMRGIVAREVALETTSNKDELETLLEQGFQLGQIKPNPKRR